MILYKGKTYDTREITININGTYTKVTVAKEDLADELYPALRVGESHAIAIDEQIMYYCDDVLWRLSDEELREFLEDEL